MLRLVQEMKLTQKLDFRMIQSLKLLPLTIMQLEQRIDEELEQNPMLQLDESPKQEEEKPKETVGDTGQVNTDSTDNTTSGDFTEADWSKYIEEGFENRYRVRQEIDPNYEERESIQTYKKTLFDSLYEQLGMVAETENDRIIGEFIIGSINDDGFLELSDMDIAEELSIDGAEITRMIDIIQKFDPPGVGARDLRETLLIQLREKGKKDSIAWTVLHDCYEQFTNRKFAEIIKALSITEDKLREAIETIGTLTPRPGEIFEDVSKNIVIPDIIVEKDEDGEYVLMHNDRYIPKININSSYRRLLDKNAKTSKETRKYLVDKLNSAKWFIDSIEQRRSTIMKVATSIVEHQKEFLDNGVSHLKPMTLQNIAEEIGIAVSTVQRVTTGKYIQTPQGVLELKYFFTQRISSSNGMDDFSAKSVKEKMKEIIAGENPKKPLSDQKISDILNKQGIKISRRAMAKYREELQIPPARLRKQL
ncbi:RNA polymerase factor sigma-54 [Candidatus Latescibacterota bacterium]